VRSFSVPMNLLSSTEQSRILRFGVFEIDVRAGQLRKSGLKLKIQDQPFQILVLLAERRGEVVTRAELRQRLWPTATFGDFSHGLNNAVNRLREVLGDSAASPRFIETLPRRGYRLVMPVELEESLRVLGQPSQTLIPVPAETRSTETAFPEAVQAKPNNRPRIILSLLAVTTFFALALAVAFWSKSRTVAHPIQSLAVLPLDNVSGDPGQEYFADGMTDALITELVSSSDLRVISRTSAMHYKGDRKQLPEIAQELKVDAIIEGTVARDANRVRVTAQLIDARTDRHLWASAYNRDLRDVLGLQSEIAQAIAGQVRAHVSRQIKQHQPKSVIPAAYEAYLRGKRASNEVDAREYFNQCLRIDPGNTDALIGLADSYLIRDPATARSLASRALDVDPGSGDAHSILGQVAYYNDWNFSVAEVEFRSAVEMSPNSAHAREGYGLFLVQMGRFEEGMKELEFAQLLDPHNAEIRNYVGLGLYFERRYDDAKQQFEGVLKDNPNDSDAHRHLMRIYEMRNQIPEFIAEFQAGGAWLSTSPEWVNRAGQELKDAYASGGVDGFRRQELRLFDTYGTGAGVIRAKLLAPARIYAHLGNRGRALALLEKAYELHLDMLVAWLKVDPEFDNLRSDPHFQSLLKRIGYPR
jgi:TolB-like protein/DNA-binding winged helix-turn-helix (wHTH) protein/Tfp pilus assembly protein PilF